MLQYLCCSISSVAAYCSVLQYLIYCSVLMCCSIASVAAYCSFLQHLAVYYTLPSTCRSFWTKSSLLMEINPRKILWGITQNRTESLPQRISSGNELHTFLKQILSSNHSVRFHVITTQDSLQEMNCAYSWSESFAVSIRLNSGCLPQRILPRKGPAQLSGATRICHPIADKSIERTSFFGEGVIVNGAVWCSMVQSVAVTDNSVKHASLFCVGVALCFEVWWSVW